MARMVRSPQGNEPSERWIVPNVPCLLHRTCRSIVPVHECLKIVAVVQYPALPYGPHSRGCKDKIPVQAAGGCAQVVQQAGVVVRCPRRKIADGLRSRMLF